MLFERPGGSDQGLSYNRVLLSELAGALGHSPPPFDPPVPPRPRPVH